MLSPGPTFAIVTRNAAAYGRGPGLATAAGIGVANATYATAAALGLSVVLQRSPAAFEAVRLIGAAYLVWLGATGLWRLGRRREGAERGEGAAAPRQARGALSSPKGASDRARRGAPLDSRSGCPEPRRRAGVPADPGHVAAPRVGANSAAGTMRPATGFGQGVLTNLLHPSVAIFYLSYIPQFIKPGEPFLARYVLLASIHVGMSTGWMAVCALAIDKLARVLRTPAFARTIEALAGLSLLVLGIVVALGR